MMGQGGNQIFRTWDNYNWSQFNFMEQRMDRWIFLGFPLLFPCFFAKHMVSS